MKWITSGDIRNWVTAKRRHCEETLPELVRRLISANASDIVKIDFPIGDSVTTGGWDGLLETPTVSPFFPAGVSGWEMGVGSPGKKADSDFAARTKKPGGLNRKASTFVFVTPRPWPGRNAWEIAKRKKKAWKNVRVIAADGLEQWLASTPAVASWFARQLGKAPEDVRDLEAAWEEFSCATEPEMIPDVVCAGRKAQVERVHQWLAAAPGVIEMQGDSSNEVIAFLYAAIAQLEDPAKTRALSRCLIVEDLTLSESQRDELLKNLRQVLHWINSYGNPSQKTKGKGLAEALDRFAPTNPLDRFAWLLGNAWPNLPEAEPRDYHAKEKLIAQHREAAARRVLDAVTATEIVAYAAKVPYPGVFGHAFAKVVKEAEDVAFLAAAFASQPLNETLIVGYGMGRIEAVGQQWIVETSKWLVEQGRANPTSVALLFLCLPENSATWATVATLGTAVEVEYWKRARGRSNIGPDEAAIAVEKMIDVGRPQDALEIAGDPKTSIGTSLLQRLVQALVTFDAGGKPIDGTMFTFYLENVFKQLYERNELTLAELGRLEWPFAQLLADDLRRQSHEPLAMHRLLQTDPSFFALLVSFLYKRDDGTVDPGPEGLTEKQKQNLRDNARQVLRSWRLFPGLASDGALDAKALTDWVEGSRKKCAETQHTKGGDLQLANILARAPSDPSDDLWPHRGVREIIEKLQNALIDQHIPIAVSNDRGVTTRGVDEGGEQERILAKRYGDMAKAMSSKWPRTAAILRAIAGSYQHAAEREDTMTDLRDLSWG